MTTEQTLRLALAELGATVMVLLSAHRGSNTFSPVMLAALTDGEREARRAIALPPSEDRYRWRPIDEMHEDYGPCAVIDIRDAGGVSMAHVCEVDFTERCESEGWTHFSQIAPLTNEQAGEMIAALDVAEAPAVTQESAQAECAILIIKTFEKLIDGEYGRRMLPGHRTLCAFSGSTESPCESCGKSWMSPDHQAPMFDPMTPR